MTRAAFSSFTSVWTYLLFWFRNVKRCFSFLTKQVEPCSFKPSWKLSWKSHPFLPGLHKSDRNSRKKKKEREDHLTKNHISVTDHSFSLFHLLEERSHSLTMTSLSSTISAVKWYSGNWSKTFPSSLVTTAYKKQKIMKRRRQIIVVFSERSLTHLEFLAFHRHQLTLLTDGELTGPGPAGEALSPGEVVPILNHLSHHFVICFSLEEVFNKWK